jgi:hypothetical protein
MIHNVAVDRMLLNNLKINNTETVSTICAVYGWLLNQVKMKG